VRRKLVEYIKQDFVLLARSPQQAFNRILSDRTKEESIDSYSMLECVLIIGGEELGRLRGEGRVPPEFSS